MYRHCAFLGDIITRGSFQGKPIRVYRCTNPERLWNVCIPGYLSMGKKRGDDGICNAFRAKSVMNSFDTGKEDD